MNRWLVAAGLLAVLLIAAAASAHGHSWWGANGWKDAGKGWKDGAGWGRAAANVTLSVATRQVTISGDGIKAALTVDVVGVNATGRVVYGTGTVGLGGVSYTAKSVAGFLGKSAVQLTIYTGNAIIKVMYHNGRYYAVVKLLGATGLQLYNGTATLTVS